MRLILCSVFHSKDSDAMDCDVSPVHGAYFCQECGFLFDIAKKRMVSRDAENALCPVGITGHLELTFGKGKLVRASIRNDI